MDGHGSHKDNDVIDYARANHVHLLSLPPHTSHKLQPLDRTFMKPFKQAYSEECAVWMFKNPGLRISDYDVAGLVNEAYKKVCRMEIATNEFACTGIDPFNPKILMDAEFAPSLITDLPQNNAQEIGAPTASCSNQQHELVELEDDGQNLPEENSFSVIEFFSHLQQPMSLPFSIQRRIISRKRRSEHSEILTGDESYQAFTHKAQDKKDQIKQKEQIKKEKAEKKKATETKRKKMSLNEFKKKEEREKRKEEASEAKEEKSKAKKKKRI